LQKPQFIDGVSKTAFTLSISLGSVTFGAYLARCTSNWSINIPTPSHQTRYLLLSLSVLTYAAIFPAYFVASPSDRHKATAALLFAFPGALLRYVLAVKLNPLWPKFPLGTFTANIVGTGLLCAFHVVQDIIPNPVSGEACNLLQGLADGFCGCLTTVSTFAVEVMSIKGRRKFLYAFASWAVSQLLILAILGPTLLARRVEKEITCKFQ
jgi:fluoride exporter